uniref:DDE Tnp4 domain-containing protein n=1 Tax=Fagus sylvatica TaxID=28930 RepID=A0A2N9E4W6_FAGSY
MLLDYLTTRRTSDIRNNRRFYPYFKDCIGAIDGTHIRASVPIEIQGRFRGRKDGTTQNVLAAITFDLKFCYVLAGWEGSAHDSRVLDDALHRSRGLKIPEGKYYLGDAGYGNKTGILSPYRKVRYHLQEFSDHPPENAQELFNLRHSSLRTTIERGFGVLKKRFRVLGNCICLDYFIVAMAKNTQKEGKGTQFKWSNPMHAMLLDILEDEALKGNKPSNTFKPRSFARVAKEISEKFEVTCLPEHASNRLRTIKTTWKTIQSIHNNSGFGWDDNLKMITCDKKTYDEYVMVHHTHDQYLNKKIEFYDQMAIVVGKDMATGSFAFSWGDETPQNVDHNPVVELDGDSNSTIKEKITDSSSLHSKGRSHRERSRDVNEGSSYSEIAS